MPGILPIDAADCNRSISL